LHPAGICPVRRTQSPWPLPYLPIRNASCLYGARSHDFASDYHSHPHWHCTEWLRSGFSISFLHMAHNLIHILCFRSGAMVHLLHRANYHSIERRGTVVLTYFPILPLTLPIPVQGSHPNFPTNPAVGPQKSVLMSLKSVVIAKLL